MLKNVGLTLIKKDVHVLVRISDLCVKCASFELFLLRKISEFLSGTPQTHNLLITGVYILGLNNRDI